MSMKSNTPFNMSDQRESAVDRLLRRILSKTRWLPYGKKEDILRAAKRHKKSFEFIVSNKFGIKIKGNTSNLIESRIYYHDTYEGYILNLLINISLCLKEEIENWSFWDVGANIGQHALVISKYVNSVTAFEPYSPVAERLEKNIKLNSAVNIRVYRIGLGCSEGNLAFLPPSTNNHGTGHFVKETNHEELNKALALPVNKGDNFINHLDPVKLIKIDAEGHELDVLIGIKQVIHLFNPVILFEVNPELGEATSSEITRFLIEREYTIWKITFTGYSDNFSLTKIERGETLKEHSEMLAIPSKSNNIHLRMYLDSLSS